MVTGQLEDSLRHEIEAFIEGRLGLFKEEIAALQKQLNESLSRLVENTGAVQMDGSLAASILEHLRAAHEEGVDLAASESARAKASSDMAIIKAATEEISGQQSQAEILKTLVNRCASFAPRVAFFVIKGNQANGWRARGLEGTVGDETIQAISLSTDSETVIGSVIKSKTTWSGGPGSHAEDHLLLSRLGDEPPQRMIAVPLIVRGRVVAVLYADSAGLDSEAINLEAIETLARIAGMAVELRSVARPTRPAEAAERPSPAMSGDYEPVREQMPGGYAPVREPATAGGYTPVREYDDSAPAVMREAPSFSGEATIQAVPATELVPARPVSDFTPQPVTHEPAVPSASAEPSSAPLGTRRRFGMDAELPVPVANEDDRRLHNDARRFARLLVSEIKLYNEQKVAEGRSESDLYDRLKEYIDRSREMYDKRVKPEVAERYDYFHQELVNTLAEGDAAKLGANYPGATVTA